VPPSVGFTEDELVVTVKDGRKIATPLSYPSLNKLTPMGIHWPDLGEDLGVAGMLKGRPAK